MGRVAVLGFDGATWRLLKPLIDEGRLPNLASLIDEGSHGILWSTVPPVTFPAWHSMFTGLNPGKIGVYGFAQVDIDAGRYVLNTVNSFRGDPVWRIASRHGVRSLIVNVPTARVEPVHGAIVGGPFSLGKLVYPGEYSWALREAGYEAYPEELSKSMLHRSRSKPSMEAVRRAIGSRFRVTRLLLDRVDPDLLVMAIFVIDNLQHFYWGDEIVEDAWAYIDEQVGELLGDLRGRGYNIIVVSDHGFTEGRLTVSITKALEEQELVALRGARTSSMRLGGLVTLGSRLGVARIARRFPWLYERLASLASRLQQGEWVGAKALESMIDWKRSRVIPVDSLVYVNPRACPDREKCIGKAIDAIRSIKGVRRVYRSEEVYTGPLHGAPDLIVEGEPGVDVIDSPNMPGPVVEGIVRPGWRAIHEPSGILIAAGPNIEPGKRVDASIMDIAPSIMAILGLEPGSEVDGAPLGIVHTSKAARAGGGSRYIVGRKAREALRRRLGKRRD